MRSTSSKGPAPVKHVPLRSCVACRYKGNKRELVRLVRTPENIIEIDTTGRKKGRGAYLCYRRECWEKALQGDKLGRALKVALTGEDRQRIMRDGEKLVKEMESAHGL